MFEQYITAFNAHDSATYSSFYAPDVVLRNGAGTTLTGAEAIVAYYTSLRSTLQRTIKIKGFVAGANNFAAMLSSQFAVIAPSVHFAGQELVAGDRVLIESIALYELRGSCFAAISAETINRNIMRQETHAV
jgi:hypothetical protein